MPPLSLGAVMRRFQRRFFPLALLVSLQVILLAPGFSSGLAVAVSGESAVAVTPNPVLLSADQSTAEVRVAWSGLVPRQLVFIDFCKKSMSDASFDTALDCGQFSGATPNGSASGAGTAEFEVFRGQDPAGESWGCYAPGDTAPRGVEKYTLCFIRVTDTVSSNYDNDSELAITYEGAPRVDPGSPTPGGGATGPVGAGIATEPPEGSDLAEALQIADTATADGVAIIG